MPFTGKATFTAGQDLPEFVEDVADIVSLLSPAETPLLEILGDAARPARSTIHEWLEDELVSAADSVNQTTFTPNATDATSITVANGTRFRSGDVVRPWGSREIMFVNSVSGNVLTVLRRYGNSPGSALSNGQRLVILAGPQLEGDDAPEPRFTSRTRKRNFTQIFSAHVQVSGTLQALRGHGVADELEYQKAQRLKELLRDLENCVLNGVAPAGNQAGNTSVRRSMNGLLTSITSNNFTPNSGGIPAGDGAGTDFNEAVLNAALRLTWEGSGTRIDTLVMGPAVKRRMNQWTLGWRQSAPQEDVYRNMVSRYESDYGRCNVVVSRNIAPDTVLLLDSSRAAVMPLEGRSFQFKTMGTSGDRASGLVVGEYTLELRNEACHAVIRGLT